MINHYKSLYICSLLIFIAACFLHFIGYFTYAIGKLSFLIYMPTLFLFFLFVLSVKSKQMDADDFLSNCNKLLFFIGILLAFYVIANFAVSGAALQDGSGIQMGHQYFLEDKGKILKEINFEQYQRLCFADYRLFTGHAMIFSIIPAIYFSSYKKGKNPSL